MRKLLYGLVGAFPNRAFGGNPLAVFTEMFYRPDVIILKEGALKVD